MEENKSFQPESYAGDEAWIQTFSGIAFPLLSPEAKFISAKDIAHALSLQCRFTGHVKKFYSVAEHCVRCARHAPQKHKLQTLLHDAQEAYISDISRPLKRCGLLNAYIDIEEAIWIAVAKRFNVDVKLDPVVKELDARALITEQRDLLGPKVKQREDRAKPFPETIRPWTPAKAEREYLKMLGGLLASTD